jgi:hypothetical protein
LIGYIDSDFASSIDDMKSTLEYVFNFGSVAISWASKKYPIVAISSTGSKYVATTITSCQALWLCRIFDDLQQGKE